MSASPVTALPVHFKMPDHARQRLQRIATGFSLISLALGFSLLGMLIIMNRHHADLNDLPGGSSIAAVDGISVIAIGTAFLVAALLHWRFGAKHSAAFSLRHRGS
ncbi:MAG: hypothetical protein JO151_01995 [Verrucomicrobia bacterium]|nr:hypothetical protein [Verrucomicrobiota bacterium]